MSENVEKTLLKRYWWGNLKLKLVNNTIILDCIIPLQRFFAQKIVAEFACKMNYPFNIARDCKAVVFKGDGTSAVDVWEEMEKQLLNKAA